MQNFQRMAGWNEMREFVRGLAMRNESLFFVDGARYGSRTRLTGLGSPCTTDVLISQTKNFWREMQARLAKEKRATSGTRTRDPRITNALLYQLSHHGFSLYVNAKVTKIF